MKGDAHGGVGDILGAKYQGQSKLEIIVLRDIQSRQKEEVPNGYSM